MKKALPLIFSILLAQSVGVLGSFFTISSIDNWYVFLVRPDWAPPSWVFGPAWVTLYTLMGIAAWLIWKKRKDLKARFALKAYALQLFLNGLWTPLFFGLRNPGIAFMEIILLWIAILFTTIFFWRIEKWAGILLLPYLAWTSFAAILNFSIWQLN